MHGAGTISGSQKVLQESFIDIIGSRSMRACVLLSSRWHTICCSRDSFTGIVGGCCMLACVLLSFCWTSFGATQAAEGGFREKVRVTPGMTLAHMTQLIMPQHANSLGITFGGQVPCPTILPCHRSVVQPGLCLMDCPCTLAAPSAAHNLSFVHAISFFVNAV